MSLLEPGRVIDGFAIGPCLHAGGMAHIYSVAYASGRAAPFPMVMKVPRMAGGDGAENIVGFEVECQVMPALRGAHVPRLVAVGDLESLPYIVMEHIEGLTLQQMLDDGQGKPLPVNQVRYLGAALAQALHSLHAQQVCHLDLKPANVLVRPDGTAVLLDFGLSCHAHLPDLLAEELRRAVGSPAWIAPEQVVGVRGDARSDLFATGVILYELATGVLPFGEPQTAGGMRQRLWAEPVPPRARRPELPQWLQEIILRCLEPLAQDRYASAAHLAFDLEHPQQVKVGARGQRLQGTGFWQQLRRWVRAAGMHYEPSPVAHAGVPELPIVMAAVPHRDVSDATLYSLRQAVQRALGTRPGARLACVTVVEEAAQETDAQRQHLAALQRWAAGLALEGHQASFHVLESGDVARALLTYARGNRVDIIVMGAATHGLQMQRLVATVPIKVAMEAPCTVMLVKQALPFELLAQEDVKSVGP